LKEGFVWRVAHLIVMKLELMAAVVVEQLV
jgi:hypothetical protein